MYALSSNAFSVDDQIADAISHLSNHPDYAASMDRFVSEFPEYNTLTWSGSWVDSEASNVDPEYMSWVADWLENNTPVYWEEGEPWMPEATDAEVDA